MMNFVSLPLTILFVLSLSSLARAQDVQPSLVVRPSTAPAAPSLTKAALLRRGESLFADRRLSTNSMSCTTCHAEFQAFNDTFKKPYPHFVQMVKDMAGLDRVNAESMVQFCMIVPMEAKPLPWASIDLAALAAYVEKLRADTARR